MTHDDTNQLRCLCHEIIIKLWEAGESHALELLKMHIERCFEEGIPAKPSEETK